MTSEPLTHVARTSLPWRDADRTVCGHPISQYAEGLVLNLADARAMARRLGQQRFALVICMTCANNAGRWAEWDDNPLMRMEREVTGGGFRKIDEQIVHELRAIGLLIMHHREEFDGLVESFASGDVVTMRDLRAMRSQRQP